MAEGHVQQGVKDSTMCVFRGYPHLQRMIYFQLKVLLETLCCLYLSNIVTQWSVLNIDILVQFRYVISS